MRNPFRYFNSSPEVIRLVVMMYIRYPLSLRQVEDILFERGIDSTAAIWPRSTAAASTRMSATRHLVSGQQQHMPGTAPESRRMSRLPGSTPSMT